MWVGFPPACDASPFTVALQFSGFPMTIQRNREQILRIAAQHGARNVRVFGSVARGEDRSDSDVDLLVEMEDGRSLLDLVGLEQALEALLERRVEVLTDASIHPGLRSRITAEARAL